MTDLYTLSPSQIIMYGTSWCGDCRRSRQVLTEKKVTYLDIDIDQDAQSAEFIQKLNNGNRSVPTIIFPDGTIMIEPDRATLAAKLDASKTA
jgi:mycoredoxin